MTQDKDKVQKYVEKMKEGAFPPILVNAEGAIIDGNHRLAAIRKIQDEQ